MLKSLVSTDEKVEDFAILIDDFNEDQYFKRMIDQWSRGKFVSFFYSRQINCQKYRKKRMDYMNKLSEKRRRELTTITIGNGASFVEFNHMYDGCSGLYPLSPLSLASKRRFSDLITYILNFINDTKGEAFSILMMKACSARLTDVVKIFIHKGSNLHSRDSNDLTPLMIACEQGQYSIIELLLKSEANVNRLLMEKVVDINDFNRFGRNPLILACGNDNSDIVRLLIETGADVNASTMYGETPLIKCSVYGDSNIVGLLIENGADINESTKNGDTPLILSCIKNNNGIARLLITKGADVNASNMYGDIPLIKSCVYGVNDIVRLLIEKGADVNESNKNGETPLIWSCKKNNSDIAQLLIENGANVNVFDAMGHTPLIWSCKNDNGSIVRLLIEKGANVNVCDMDEYISPTFPFNNEVFSLIRTLNRILKKLQSGNTPLMSACENGNYNIAKFLIEHGSIVYTPDDYETINLLNVDIQNRIGQTALTLACSRGNTNIVSLIISKKPDLNVRDFNGMTALSYASKHGFYEIVQILIFTGADIFLANKDGKTPLMYANEIKDRKIENFISKHLYKSQIFDRKISSNQAGIEVIYERTRKYTKVENDIH